VLLAGLKPVFVDVNDRFQMDTLLCEQAVTERTLCVFPAHLLGKFCFIPNVSVPVVEDCCEAMGGEIFGKKFGRFGIAGAFSMYPSHTITTGEGGLVISDDDQFMRICRSIHNHGKIAQDFDFQYTGINAKMTNLQAALGCSLVKHIDKVNEKRQDNVFYYNFFLGGEFETEAPHCYPVIFKNSIERDSALRLLDQKGVEARKLMSCVPELKCFERIVGGYNHYPNAHHFATNGLFLPVHQNLSVQEIEYICDIINKLRR
jgi:dTDP-4-amino-4,6-dideoxygalactose transaminase